MRAEGTEGKKIVRGGRKRIKGKQQRKEKERVGREENRTDVKKREERENLSEAEKEEENMKGSLPPGGLLKRP